MVTHWESSTRPLFVKTVWRDGQHHVVLRKEEDSISRRNTNSSSHNSARSVRSAKKTSSSNKQISASVKLVLAGVGTFNSGEKKLIRCKSSIKPLDTSLTSPKGTSAAFRHLNGVLNTTTENKATRNLSLCIKSNSIDINGERENYNKVGTMSPYFSCNNYIDPCKDSLSERVMVWLDLAIQNGNYTKEIKIQPQRIVTACHISQQLRHTPTKRQSVVNCKLDTNCDRNERSSPGEGTSRDLRSGNSSVSSQSLALEEENVVSKENSATIRQLSSEVEESIVVKDLEQTLPRKQVNSVKRQLHIFMPNLPNKYSDCDSSILSSKISTSSLQRSIDSKKSKNNFK